MLFQSVQQHRWKSNLCVSVNQRGPVALSLSTASLCGLGSQVRKIVVLMNIK